MSYIDVLKQTQNVMTPGSSACQGCGFVCGGGGGASCAPQGELLPVPDADP